MLTQRGRGRGGAVVVVHFLCSGVLAGRTCLVYWKAWYMPLQIRYTKVHSMKVQEEQMELTWKPGQHKHKVYVGL